MSGCGAFTLVQGTVGGHNQPNEEEVNDVEDGETPNNLLGSPRDLLKGIGRLGSSQSSELSASIGERRRDENGAEALEAVEERTVRIVPGSSLLALLVASIETLLSIPVCCTKIAPGVRRNTAASNNDGENHEAQASGDLHDAEDELNLFQSARIRRKSFR